jgi:hypothetical protein
MFASIVGHAIFQTAAHSGPSTMERSYRLPGGPAAGAGRSPGVVVAIDAGAAAASVTRDRRASIERSSDQVTDALPFG